MAAPRRILLIRPSALGDVCRSVPVLASLRAAYPEAEIDWLVQDSFAEAVRHHPALTRAVPFPRAELGRTSRRGDVRPSLAWMQRTLRVTPRYDLVVDAQGLFRSGLFSWWTGAARRVGYANAGELGALFYTERIHVPAEVHAVDRMLALVGRAGAEPVRDMRLYAGGDDRRWAASQGWGGSFAVLAPTSRWPGKQWPAARFTELARRLLASGVPAVVIVGGRGERGQIDPLLRWAADEPRAVDLVGSTSIGRLLAVIERAGLVVANDSAALHMAVGFDRPAVALFGPTGVSRVGPYAREGDVIQHRLPGETASHKDREAGAAMMARIGVDEVLGACLSRLRAR